ncbi:TIM barrel protein, partial [Candidatus Woesearchaeota archaeon]|nr:TIM barrel protein [Candidatus Woesearchaeota archaeon]
MQFPQIKPPSKLLFGTAGIPLSTEKPSTLSGIQQVKKLGLDAMELEFVQSVHLNEESAQRIFAANKDITLTCHGQYFINLNANEPQKIGASRSRILKAANISRLAGAWSMTFHAAYYLGMEHETVYKNVKEQMKKIVDELKSSGNSIWVRPETTGKPTQFGSLKEILRLSQELDQVMPCVDFAHLHARTGGKENSTAEFRATLEMIEKALG